MAWSPLPVAHPSPPGATFTLNAVAHDPQGLVYAAGGAGFQHWDGHAWQIHPVPAVPPLPGAGAASAAQITALVARHANDLWAAGYVSFGAQAPMPTGAVSFHWDGGSWSYRGGFFTSAPSQSLFNGIAAVGTDMWAVGAASSSPSPLVTRWDGKKWQRISVPGKRAVLNAVAGAGGEGPWVVGHTYVGAFPLQPITRRWNGGGWDFPDTPHLGEEAVLTGVTVVAPDEVWAVGSRGPSPSKHLILRWDGTAWKVSPLPQGLAPGFLWAVGSSGPKRVWAVGEQKPPASGGYPRTLVLRWDGTRWKEETIPDLTAAIGSGYATKFDYLRAVAVRPGQVSAAGVVSHGPVGYGQADLVLKR